MLKRPGHVLGLDRCFFWAVTRTTERTGNQTEYAGCSSPLSLNALSAYHLRPLWHPVSLLRTLSCDNLSGNCLITPFYSDDQGSECSHHLPQLEKLSLEPRPFSRKHKRNATGLITQHTQEQPEGLLGFSVVGSWLSSSWTLFSAIWEA